MRVPNHRRISPRNNNVPRGGLAGEDQLVSARVGWGWETLPHGQTLASDVLGQFVNGDPSRPNFGSYGPYGGADDHSFFFFAFNAGRYQRPGGMSAHLGIGKLAVPDYWNQRVLLFDLNPDGSLKSRRASGLIGQTRFDRMEIGQGPDHFQYPAETAFDPSGKFLFVVDEYNHRVLQFDTSAPERAVRVFGQPDFDQWGPDSSPGHLLWNSTRLDVRGPKDIPREPHARGFFLPRGVATDGKRLFVSDCDNHRVLVFETRRTDRSGTTGTENGPEAVAVLGQADFTGYKPNRGGPRGPETMLFPAGLDLARDGSVLLVADGLNGRVLVFDVSGTIQNGQSAIAVLPIPDADSFPDQPEEKKLEGAVSVAADHADRVYVSDLKGPRVLVYDLNAILSGNAKPLAGIGKFELMTDLRQTKPGYVGPMGLATAARFLYVAEPRGNRVLCYDTSNPDQRAVNLLGQSFGNDVSRPDYNKYGPNNGPDPYGFDFADGSPALSVSEDGKWLLVADTIGGRLMFFPIGPDGLALDRSARFALGTPTLTARANSYGAERFNRPNHSVFTKEGRLFASDFQGSRILYFELPNIMAGYGEGALAKPREFIPPKDRKPHPREDYEFRSIDSGIPALAVLGQVDFYAGLRDTASQRQMGKEMSGLVMDWKRGWLFIGEKLNHRVLIVDVNKEVSTFMPAKAVLGQPDFDSNEPTELNGEKWNPAGMNQPSGIAYDNRTQILYVTHGNSAANREILGFDLSGEITNGMAPILRIGGPHSTVETDLPYVHHTLALDEQRGRLYSGLIALDISGNVHQRVPVIGWFGLGTHPNAEHYQEYHTNEVPNLLGYSVGFCHRFGGAINATTANPHSGTFYLADNARYRVLCFQPEFHFRRDFVRARIGEEMIDVVGDGGLAPLSFAVTQGQLPPGLDIDPQTGLITGTPSGPAGEHELAVHVKTAVGEETGKVRIVVQDDGGK